jgi:hypothetical protein
MRCPLCRKIATRFLDVLNQRFWVCSLHHEAFHENLLEVVVRNSMISLQPIPVNPVVAKALKKGLAKREGTRPHQGSSEPVILSKTWSWRSLQRIWSLG